MPRFDRLEMEQPSDEPNLPLRGGDPERDEKYWLRLADENRRAGSYESALRYYSRALEQDKSLVTGWVGQVQMLVALEEYSEADLWGRKALELFKNQGDLMAGRAQALCRKGDRKKALELCDGALRQDGQSAYRWQVRGELMVTGHENIDRHCFDKAMQLDPDWLVPLEIALAYLHYGFPTKAQLRARQAVEKGPQSPYCWYVQGCCELELDLERQARQSLEHCLELSPRHADAERRLRELANRGWSFRRSLRRFLGLS
jgi:tetratricopeptide (TPR) repeat protein